MNIIDSLRKRGITLETSGYDPNKNDEDSGALHPDNADPTLENPAKLAALACGWAIMPTKKPKQTGTAHYFAKGNAASLCGRIWCASAPRSGNRTEPNGKTCPECQTMLRGLISQGH